LGHLDGVLWETFTFTLLNNAITMKGYTVLKDRQIYECLIYKYLEAGAFVIIKTLYMCLLGHNE